MAEQHPHPPTAHSGQVINQSRSQQAASVPIRPSSAVTSSAANRLVCGPPTCPCSCSPISRNTRPVYRSCNSDSFNKIAGNSSR